VKYLMDQAEAYAGLVAAERLADPATAVRARADAARMKAGVAALWNPARSAFDWAVHEDGARHATDWSVLYPDALQQAWAAAYGLTEPEVAAQLLSHLDSAHPEWHRPDQPSSFSSGRRPAGYWALVAWAFQRGGRPSLGTQAASDISQAADASARVWPFTTMDAGELLLAESDQRTSPLVSAGALPGR
jgi:hypothetical protein